MVYPTLLAATGDVAHPAWRASAVGVYRLWRDLGYAIGAVLAGAVADALGIRAAIWLAAKYSELDAGHFVESALVMNQALEHPQKRPRRAAARAAGGGVPITDG